MPRGQHDKEVTGGMPTDDYCRVFQSDAPVGILNGGVPSGRISLVPAHRIGCCAEFVQRIGMGRANVRIGPRSLGRINRGRRSEPDG